MDSRAHVVTWSEACTSESKSSVLAKYSHTHTHTHTHTAQTKTQWLSLETMPVSHWVMVQSPVTNQPVNLWNVFCSIQSICFSTFFASNRGGISQYLQKSRRLMRENIQYIVLRLFSIESFLCCPNHQLVIVSCMGVEVRTRWITATERRSNPRSTLRARKQMLRRSEVKPGTYSHVAWPFFLF